MGGGGWGGRQLDQGLDELGVHCQDQITLIKVAEYTDRPPPPPTAPHPALPSPFLHFFPEPAVINSLASGRRAVCITIKSVNLNVRVLFGEFY